MKNCSTCFCCGKTGIKQRCFAHRAFCSSDCRNWVNQKYGDLKARLLKRDGKKCVYCGLIPKSFLELEFDHKRPKSKGGKDSILNGALACKACNIRKGNLILNNDVKSWLASGISIEAWRLKYGMAKGIRKIKKTYIKKSVKQKTLRYRVKMALKKTIK